jgi:multiple sugar transport system substrate-binding protein
MERRVVASLIAAVLLLVSVVGFGGSEVVASEQFDWRRFEGQQISIIGVEGVYNEQILEAIQPFEEKTGIKVAKVDFIPEAEYTNKVQMLSAARSSEYDVFMVSFTNLFDWVPNNWIVPLDDFVNDPTLADPDLDLDDFYPEVLNNCYWNGVSGYPLGKDTPGAKLYALPHGWILFNLLYRTDIFEKYDLKVPETIDELIEVGEFIQEHEPGMYGVAMRGFKAVDMLYGGIWQTILSYGGADLDENLDPIFDSPENIRGLEKVAEMINRVGNVSNWANVTWYEVLTDLQAGKCAMAIDAPSLATWIATGEDTPAKGKIDIAPPIYGDTKDETKSMIFGWNLGINAYGTKKEAAWYFIQYVTGKERQMNETLKPFPTRQSVMGSEKVRNYLVDLGMKNFVDAWNETAKYAGVLLTPSKGFNDYGYVLAGELQAAVLGQKSAEDALAAVSKYYRDNYK